MREGSRVNIHDPDKIGAVLQECIPQGVSKVTVEFWGDLLNTVDLSKYPEATQLRIIEARKDLQKRKEFNKTLEILKEDFFNFLDEKKVPIMLSRFGARKVRPICKKEFVIAFREEGYDLPPYLVTDYVNEYIRKTMQSGKAHEAWKKSEKEFRQFKNSVEGEAKV